MSLLRSGLLGAVGVLAAFALGGIVGVLGAVQHVQVVEVGDVRLPVGVILGLLALVLAQLVARDAVGRGLGAAVVLVGWVVAVVTMGTSRPEGDIVVPAGLAGEGFLYGGFLLGGAVAVVAAFGDAGRRATRARAQVVASGSAEPRR